MSYKVCMPRPMYFETLEEASRCAEDYRKQTRYVVAVVESKHTVTHIYKIKE